MLNLFFLLVLLALCFGLIVVRRRRIRRELLRIRYVLDGVIKRDVQ